MIPIVFKDSIEATQKAATDIANKLKACGIRYACLFLCRVLHDFSIEIMYPLGVELSWGGADDDKAFHSAIGTRKGDD